jgi:hypothetical protein
VKKAPRSSRMSSNLTFASTDITLLFDPIDQEYSLSKVCILVSKTVPPLPALSFKIEVEG